MNQYKEIDDLVETYKNGQAYPRNSPERENAKVAGEMLVMTFKPLVLSVLSTCQILDDQFEDGFQDGCVAFIEGLNKFDPAYGSGFNAFIKGYLTRYFMKWKGGQFNRSVRPSMTLDTPVAEGLILLEVIKDPQVDIEAGHLEAQGHLRQQDKLRHGIGTLTPVQKEIIYSHYQESISLHQIARNKGLSISTVRSYHDRALKKIKKFL